MGLWKWLFGKKKNREELEEELTEYELARSQVNFHDDKDRSRYLTDCLEQIGEAQREMELLRGEYSLVTAYLTDIEEVEALPEEESEEVKRVANKILSLDKDRLRYLDRKDRMSETDYQRMEGQEEEAEDGIAKMKEAEKHRKLIQQDLHRLEGERGAYHYRRGELVTMMANLKGMTTICVTAFLACLLMLLVLQFGFQMDASVGYLIAVAAAAVVLTVAYVKYTDAQRELERVEKATNKLIQLQNRVKIRLVNNINLLDYLYMKYGVESGNQLEKRWRSYQKEKEERRQFAENEAKLDYYREEIVKILGRYQLKDPDRWAHQISALVDPKEMIEIRHGLISRRQSLRSQIEYNQKVAETASTEIKEVAREYPMYQAEITSMVERFEGLFS